jgi:hypothetical protein
VTILTMSPTNKIHLLEIMRECMETPEINERAILLEQLNNSLPIEHKIQIPHLLTNTLINNYLYSLEEHFF